MNFHVSALVKVDVLPFRMSMSPNDLPFAVGVKAEDPNTKRIRLVPFADPKARITYFRAPDLKGSVCEPDELFAR